MLLLSRVRVDGIKEENEWKERKIKENEKE
jgi:hypothetical protein